MTEEKIDRPRTELEVYGPNRKARELETRHLPEFEQLEEGLIVVASGSPRSGRLLDRFPQLKAIQLSDGLAKERLQIALDTDQIPESYRHIAEEVIEFEELKRQWRLDAQGETSDRGLSLAKARMGAAAAILLQIANDEGMPERFMAIGRDYNLANCELEFLDKPGYGGALAGKPAAISPYEQFLMLYRPVGYYRDQAFKSAQAAIMAGNQEQAQNLLTKLATAGSRRASDLLSRLQEDSRSLRVELMNEPTLAGRKV